MKPKLKAIDEQAVVLFGATSGIGLETALQMVEKGAQVAIVGRSQEGLNEALDKLRQHAEASRIARGRGNGSHNYQASSMASMEAGGAPVANMTEQVIGLEADITNFDQVRGVAEQVVQTFGRIDTWVNVAAVSEWALFEDTTPDEFRRIIEVNLVGHAYGAMAALPYMKQENGGALIFVSSVAGRVPIPYQSAYNASKHGILGLAETLRMELKYTHVPISVTTILPASMNTPLFEKARTKLGVEPDPIPPVYDARMVARSIIHAAQHPVRELIVGDAGHAVMFMRRLAPTLTSNYMGATGFRQQRSNEPKSAQAPDNLYHHLGGYNQVDGEHLPFSGRISMLTWLSTHPRARMAIVAGLASLVGGFLGYRMIRRRNQYRSSLRYQIPYRAKKVAKQAGMLGKQASHTARDLSKKAGRMQVVANMPMFRRKSYIERVSERAGDIWDAVLGFVMALPFVRRKSMAQRVADRVKGGGYRLTSHLPFIEHRPTLAERLTLSEQRKAASEYAVKSGKSAAEFVTDRTRTAADFVSEQSHAAADFASRSKKQVSDKVDDRMPSRKEMRKNMKHAADKLPTRKEIRRGLKRAADKLPEREQVEVRRRMFIDKRPLGEYREVVVEKRKV